MAAAVETTRSRAPQRIVRDAVGIGLAVGVYAVSFGVLAVAAGLSAAQACVMSMLVFTGASQFAFVGVLAGGGGALAAFGPAVVLAARNAAYGLSLAPILRGRLPQRALAAQLVIDETTAMAIGQPTQAAKRYAFWATGITLCSLWQLGTLIGALVGRAIDPADFGLDAAAPAVYLALLWPNLNRTETRVVAVAGALLAVALVPIAPPGLPVVAAAAVAVVAGLRRGRP